MSFKSIVNGQTTDKTDQKNSPCPYVTGELTNQELHQCPGIASVSNSLDSDQDRHFVGPDLGPNCLQKSSADDTRR